MMYGMHKNSCTITFTSAYDGQYWHVLKDYDYLKGAKLDTRRQHWLSSMPNNVTKAADETMLAAPV